MKLTSKKTITIFCPVTLPLKSGAGINAFNLAKEFLKLDYNVRVVSFRRDDHRVYDNIEGIDIVPNRNIVDFTCNDYGSVMIDFLINSIFCVLNGRNCTINDFTCIRPQGTSVVDYCLISHNNVDMFTECTIHRPSDLINRTRLFQIILL